MGHRKAAGYAWCLAQAHAQFDVAQKAAPASMERAVAAAFLAEALSCRDAAAGAWASARLLAMPKGAA